MGEGEGFTINIPLYVDCRDIEYVGILDKVLRPIALDFRPEMILVSAGFDSYVNDPVGGMGVTSEGYAAMTRVVMEIADTCCAGKLVLALEGGYDPKGLAGCVKSVLLELSGSTRAGIKDVLAGDHLILDQILLAARKHYLRYWKNL